MQTNLDEAAQAGFDNVFAREEQPVAQEAEKPPHYEVQPRDEQGKWTAEQQASQPEAQPVQPEPTPQQVAQPAPTEAPEARDQTGRMIPLPELLNERQKRQEAERRAIEHEAQLRLLQQQMAQSQAQPQQHAQQQQLPDLYEDPQGFVRGMQSQMQFAMREQISNLSESNAVHRYGAETVKKAQEWAIQNGAASHFFWNARDPYGEAVEAYRKAEALNRIGPDPDAYEKRLRDEVRAQVLAELKAGNATQQPKPQFPGSLASATATGAQGAVLTPQAAADAVFARPGR